MQPSLTKAEFEITAQASSAILERFYQMLLDISCVLIKNKLELTIDIIFEMIIVYVGFNLGSIFQANPETIVCTKDIVKNQKELAIKFAKIIERKTPETQEELKQLMREEGIAIPQTMDLIALISDKVADSKEYFLATNQNPNEAHIGTMEIIRLITPEMEHCLNDTWQYLSKAFEKNLIPAYEILLGVLCRVVLLSCLVLSARFGLINAFIEDVERYFDGLLSGVQTCKANTIH